MDQSHTVLILLAQTQDTTRADRYAGRANGVNRCQTLVVGSSADDLAAQLRFTIGSEKGRKTPYLWVKLARRVQVVIVRAETSFL